MDHDRLFKELLTTFFIEFLELFFPKLAAEIDRDSIQFLDKEIFTDLSSGERHEVDLLVKVRLRGREIFILVHVENQATWQANFPERMFEYFTLLHGKLGLPIYPIAIFSYDRPVAPAADRYEIDVIDLPVLRFQFQAIQLNRLNWREFLKTPNPVASALMTKMSIAPEDRPRVKLECLRMVATLKLDPARSELIGAFMNSYLKLTAAETLVYNQELQAMAPKEKEIVMEVFNEWTEMGRIEGRAQGEAKARVNLLARQLRRRFGEVPPEISESIRNLTSEQAGDFADAMIDFKSLDEVQAWLARS
jgi:predicted transposase YdaD